MNSNWASLAVEVEATSDESLTDAAVDRLGQGLIELLALELPLGSAFRFEPQGISLVRFGNSGRIAIHTWPERSVATIDLWLKRAEIDSARAQLAPFLEKRHGARVTAMRAVAS